jgi:hypothetical protein
MSGVNFIFVATLSAILLNTSTAVTGVAVGVVVELVFGAVSGAALLTADN